MAIGLAHGPDTLSLRAHSHSHRPLLPRFLSRYDGVFHNADSYYMTEDDAAKWVAGLQLEHPKPLPPCPKSSSLVDVLPFLFKLVRALPGTCFWNLGATP